MPYIFQEDPELMDYLLMHIYQRSISEILGKLLTQLDSDYDTELQAIIKAKQLEVAGKLVDCLSAEHCEESNLNAATIIQDMFDIRDYQPVIFKAESMAKIVKWAVDVSGTPETRSSEICSLQVLNQVISNINERQKKADNKETSSGKDNEDFDEDDVTLQQVNSDDEDSANAPSTHAAALVEAFQGQITNIENVLRSDVAGTPIANSYSTAETVPLGALRLHTVELILKLV